MVSLDELKLNEIFSRPLLGGDLGQHSGENRYGGRMSSRFRKPLSGDSRGQVTWVSLTGRFHVPCFSGSIFLLFLYFGQQ